MIRSVQRESLNEDRKLCLYHDAADQLVCVEGSAGSPQAVIPRRLFPLTDPGGWIELRDLSGSEVACIGTSQELDQDSWGALQRQLDRQEFAPQVLRILSMRGDAAAMQWTVVTDRGETSFQLASEADVRCVGQHGVLITDSVGIRYHITDRRALDRASRHLLEWYA